MIWGDGGEPHPAGGGGLVVVVGDGGGRHLAAAGVDVGVELLEEDDARGSRPRPAAGRPGRRRCCPGRRRAGGATPGGPALPAGPCAGSPRRCSPAAGLGGAAALDPGPPAVALQLAQAPDDQRVVGRGVGRADQVGQQLVVPGRRQADPGLDRRSLRARLRPPGALEVEDRTVAIGQRHPRQAARIWHPGQAPPATVVPTPVWRSPVAQATCNRQAVGSNPTTGSISPTVSGCGHALGGRGGGQVGLQLALDALQGVVDRLDVAAEAVADLLVRAAVEVEAQDVDLEGRRAGRPGRPAWRPGPRG